MPNAAHRVLSETFKTQVHTARVNIDAIRPTPAVVDSAAH
jgi:hypothetical protein